MLARGKDPAQHNRSSVKTELPVKDENKAHKEENHVTFTQFKSLSSKHPTVPVRLVQLVLKETTHEEESINPSILALNHIFKWFSINKGESMISCFSVTRPF